jgi:PAS domain S-box-containing protein
VLVLNSYHQGYEWTDGMVEGIRQAVSNDAPDALVYVEYMDSKRFWSGQDGIHAERLAALYRLKYGPLEPDVIVTTDDNAFQFILRRREELFPGVPVVFCGVNEFAPGMIAGREGITGVVEKLDQEATIDLALSLSPQAKRVALITDTTPTGLGNRELLKELAPKYADRAPFVFLDEDGEGITLEELLGKLRALPPDSVVLYMDFFRDRQGRYLDPAEVVPKVSQASPAPVYSMGSFYLGKGIVGGKITRSVDQGMHAGQMACRILEGASVASMPVLAEGASRYVFDYRQLERFGIAQGSLPPGSIVENRPFSFYRTYRELVWGVTAVVGALLALLALMAINMQRRRRAERSLRTLFEGVPDAVFVYNRGGRIVHCNEVACWQTGYDRRELLAMRMSRIEGEGFAASFNDRVAELQDNGRRSGEGEHVTRDGRRIPVDINASLIPYRGEELILAVVRDITDRKQAEEALRASEHRFRSFVENANDIVYALRPDGRFSYVSPNWQTFMGEPASLAVGRHFADYVHPEDVHLCEEFLQRVLRTGGSQHSVEYRVRSADGELRWHVSTGSTLLDEAEQATSYIGIARDVTEEKRAQEAILESEQRFRGVFEAASVGIALVRPDGGFLRVNRAFGRIVGRSEDDLARGNVRELALWSGEEDPEGIARVLTGWSDGEQAERAMTRPDGAEAWVSVHTSVLRGPKGDPRYAILVLNDQTENRRLQSELLQAQKMEAVGRLAGGVAHDFNNMLQTILGYTDMLLARTDAAADLAEDLEEIRRAAQRSAELTRQLLAFARKQTINPELLDLNETVSGVLRMLHRLIGEDIELTWKPRSDGCVRMDPVQVDQILANLVVNARDAIVDGGRIVIETDSVDVGAEDIEHSPDSQPGPYVLLSVSDNGKGMDAETLAQVFEPFFTTKPTDQGTGLGLATVYGIVKQNGGFIHVESQPSSGTVFRVYLPRQDAPRPRADEPSPPQAKTGSETVLIVEDDQAILQLGKQLLTNLGYSVLAASTPSQALEIAGRQGHEIALLLTDVVMPQMSGRDLWARIRQDHPQLPCLYMSGYTADVIAHKGVLDKGVRFLQKPFTAAQLGEKVRQALDVSPGD